MAKTDNGVERSSLSDDALVERVGSGDRQAFDVLYDRYFPRVYGFVRRRLGNRADIEESVQEVFTAVFCSLESFRGDAPFAAWVLGVARRTVASRFKRKQHPTVSLDAADEPEGIDLGLPGFQREPTPLEHYECGELVAQLQRTARRRLSQEQRRLFELHHLQHHSIQELARVEGKSEDSIKSNLYRARKLLLAR